jgi:TPP-dependent indolepyruvate ferredoxin oxidoreductase alpha subunit
VILRLTTRVCHSKTLVTPAPRSPPPPAPGFKRDVPARVMIPAYAKPAHHRLRAKMAEIAAWNEAEGLQPRRRRQPPWASSAAASPPCTPWRRRPRPAT